MRITAGAAARFLFDPPSPAPPVTLAAGAGARLAPGAGAGGSPAFGTNLGRGAPYLAPFDVDPSVLAALAGWSREAAMSVPTVSRARNLLCSTVAALPIVTFRATWNPSTATTDLVAVQPLPWTDRPDPNRTRSWMLSWTVDDLLFHAKAFWRILGRYSDTGLPTGFERMPAAEVEVAGDGSHLRWGNVAVAAADAVEFLAPLDGLLVTGARTVRIAVNLDAAAERFSTVEVPAGWLQQTGGEPLSGDALDALGARWSAARRANSTGALNPSLEYHESTMDPDKLQLTASREHSALEIARLANVPPYLVGAPTGGSMDYTNAAEAKGHMIDLGALPYIQCVEQTLSGPNVTPRGQLVRLDTDAWLRSPFTSAATPSENPDPTQPSPTTEVPT